VPVDPDQIKSNLAAVRRRLDQAARTAGRNPSDIRLVAVSKTFSADAVRAAAAAGQIDFGENKVQEGLQKIADTGALPLRWHLIGHLQSNKARRAAAAFHAIHSIDRIDLLYRLDAAAAEAGTTPDVLVQVDLAGEETKFGASAADLPALFRADLRAARLVGLMLLPPEADNPEDARPWFRRLRELRDRLAEEGIPADRLRELSMGMSHDFEVAAQEGSTLVRVGTAIFGRRTPTPGPETSP
jgi:pyridoxal phosphate enzyme (YggS family)